MKNLTRQAMADSLRTLLRERPLSRISVRDITEGCHVNRQTFYYHFRDVYDLMFWTTEQDMITYLEENRVDKTNLREYTIFRGKPGGQNQFEGVYLRLVQPVL